MAKKATVIVTVYRSPVHPVTVPESAASNIFFGEMTPSHARRNRRKQRARLASRGISNRTPTRFF